MILSLRKGWYLGISGLLAKERATINIITPTKKDKIPKSNQPNETCSFIKEPITI